ncbi:MAG: glycosyltransferase [Spirochaetaceae bacterium]|nr:MAG: glycosyltransferase [Spirochaetaceae bacterium]
MNASIHRSTRPLRVVFVMHGFQPGQKQMQFLNYARLLPPDVRLLMLFIRPVDQNSEVWKGFQEAGAEVRSLNCRVDLSPASIGKVLRVFREFAPDIIHSQHAVGGVNAKIAGALYRRRNPAVRIICEQRNARKGLSRLGRTLDPATFRFADLVLSSSAGVERSYFSDSEVLDQAAIEAGRFDPVRRRHYTFHNSIDPDLFADASSQARQRTRAEVRQELGIPDDAFVFIATGRFVRQKAYDLLMHALAAVSRDTVRLLCVGDGPLLDDTHRISVELGVQDRVLFPGFRSDVDRLYRAADCFVLSSRWEGLPKVLLEAMCVGLPSIVTDVEGSRDVLADTDAGVLVPVEDAAALGAAMETMAGDPERARRMGREALQRVDAFSVRQKTAELHQIYQVLLGGHPLHTEAERHLVAAARSALADQREDGTMPPGVNGTWNQEETPVRLTAHWSITFLTAYQLTGEAPFRVAAERALAALCDQRWRPHGYAWHCLGDGTGHNDGNGLIGQAWVMEAFYHAFVVLNRTDLLQRAEQLYGLHRQDPRTGMYFVLGVDGAHHLPDATFNHQVWFAAVSALVLRTGRGLPTAGGPALFARRLFAIMHRNPRYVVEQKVRHRYHGNLPGYLRQAASNIYHRVVTRSLRERSVGYLSFTLHGVALLKDAMPTHPVWRSRKFAALVRHATRYMNRPAFFEECTRNRFAFPHNVTGAEVSYVARVFGASLPSRRFWDHQIAEYWDTDRAQLCNSDHDPRSLAARMYEMVYLLPGAVPQPPTRIALVVRSMAGGGAQRAMITLARGALRLGHPVDLVLAQANGPLMAEVPPQARVVDLQASRGVRAIRPLRHYLQSVLPDAAIATLNYMNVVTLVARAGARVTTPVAVREANTLAAHTFSHDAFKRRIVVWMMKRWYPRAARVIVNSQDSAAGLVEWRIVPRSAIEVIPNPLDVDFIETRSREPLDHPWFAPDAPPVILAAGRLVRQKDFETLIRAFALFAERNPHPRLVIIGDGARRQTLRDLAGQLGVGERVQLPGFVDNPYQFMARSALFVLSSAWEGSPNVVTEALACGLPVVATTCPGGARDLLANAGFARLVPVGDHQAMAGAMQELLSTHAATTRSSAPDGPRALAATFGVEEITRHYLQTLGIVEHSSS